MTAGHWSLRYGATVEAAGTRFRLWAPNLREVQVVTWESPRRVLHMEAEAEGEFTAFAAGLGAGTDYIFQTGGGRELPDPVSRWQPAGVHGPSRVVDPAAFAWSDQDWRGIPLRDYIIYELHTGTFTSAGTFESIIPRLSYLRDLGITGVEIMPVAEFPGRRNWGYDGVGMYAPQSSYGGPTGLKTLIDACHKHGLAVVLDVVYNHLGPEGNYLAEFGPFFTQAYRTPWGDAINYDGPGSDGVRRFFVGNALYWLTEYHVDALRLDAIHGIFDFSAHHILQEIAEAFHAQAQRLGRAAWLIAESDLNDVRVIKPAAQGGYGIDAQWHDDFHHALHSALTGETRGYFADFDGLPSLSRAITEGFVYTGQHSKHRRRRHGSSSADRPGEQFVVFTANHDQIANALLGIRPSITDCPERQKLAAAVLLFAPFLPLLFMGQEYGEIAPFYYFTDHTDPALAAAVREGRRKETERFLGDREFADPQDPTTFERSKLNWSLPDRPPHSGMLAWYRNLLALRKEQPSLHNCRKDLVRVEVNPQAGWMLVERGDPAGGAALLACNFAEARQRIPVARGNATWRLRLWSGAGDYGQTLPAPAGRIFRGTPEALELVGSGAALYLADQTVLSP